MAATTLGYREIAQRLTVLGCTAVLESDIKELIEHIRSQPNGDKFIEGLTVIPLPKALSAPTNAVSFGKSTPGNCSILNLWVYQRISLKTNSPNKTFDGQSGGVTPGIPGGIYWGTLYFDNEADISSGWDYEMNILVPYFNVNFIRGGQTIMTFQAGGVGTGLGIAGGHGNWD